MSLPIISSFSREHGRDDPRHNWQTGVVRYWVDITIANDIIEFMLPIHGDKLSRIVDDSYIPDNVCISLCMNGHPIATGVDRLVLGYDHALPLTCEDSPVAVSIRLDKPSSPTTRLRAEYLLELTRPVITAKQLTNIVRVITGRP